MGGMLHYATALLLRHSCHSAGATILHLPSARTQCMPRNTRASSPREPYHLAAVTTHPLARRRPIGAQRSSLPCRVDLSSPPLHSAHSCGACRSCRRTSGGFCPRIPLRDCTEKTGTLLCRAPAATAAVTVTLGSSCLCHHVKQRHRSRRSRRRRSRAD